MDRTSFGRLRWTLALVVCVSMLAGCEVPLIRSGTSAQYADPNEVPVATNFETSLQPKLQATDHWNRVAIHAAEALTDALKTGGMCLPGTGCTTLVMERRCKTSACNPEDCDPLFNRVFHNQFVSALVNLGYKVADAPVPGGITVNADIQPVVFSPNRPQFRYAGELIELGQGVWALQDVVAVIDDETKQFVEPHVKGWWAPAGPYYRGQPLPYFFDRPGPYYDDRAAHWYRTKFASGPTPSTEVVITVSAQHGDKTFAARNTSMYYVADVDRSHYICERTPEPPPPAPPPPEPSIPTIPVYGDCSEPRCTTCEGRSRCETAGVTR